MTGDMIHFAYNRLFSGPSVDQLADRTALVVALVCLLRVSEYLPSVAGRPSRHYLKAKDVKFVVRTRGGTSYVESTSIHQYVSLDVSGVVLFIRSGKRDQEGATFSMPFDKSSSTLFDITDVLFKWSSYARPLPARPLLSTQSG